MVRQLLAPTPLPSASLSISFLLPWVVLFSLRVVTSGLLCSPSLRLRSSYSSSLLFESILASCSLIVSEVGNPIRRYSRRYYRLRLILRLFSLIASTRTTCS